MDDGAELSVRSAKLQGFPPFPTWNGTVAAPLWDDRGLLSVLGADGELVVLQSSQRKDDEHATNDSCLRVRKVLPSAGEKVASFCQCWSSDGSVVAVAHDRRVVFYSGEDFRVLARMRLRYNVGSMDITKRRYRSTVDGDDRLEFLLIVGTAFGGLLYKVELQSERGGDGEQTLAHVARVHDEVAVCSVKFSGDGCNAAMGTMDGRLFVRRLDTQEDEELSTFGSTVMSKVLIAPRVTSMSFSACSTKLVVATRKGNVYVFIRASETGEWQTLSSCKDLSANPKPKASGAAGVSKSATAAQTLVACWGPVFVVCSRAVTSRLEMYDFASGCLLHSLQLAPVAASSTTLNTWVDQQLVTGICVLQTGDGSSRLMCHDTSTNLVLVEWPFLDAMNER
ncbi:hypothetical protein PR001_g13701 [Phytophthora rubi]|uniref:Anaphase-promoting complex subunit 4 WD40 domain-containing protein n=1 Tax=Phytophthora rubi TaxID=129364 RepID=A0A6A3LPU4_9STRA|nr:hypothetical protein PR002_g14095 [Phytophthora rubi]KAE9020077.1 hypothetical protein PR001_g13701 [Phytophthora rubi]